VDPVRLGAASVGRLRLSVKRRVVEAELPFHALSLSRCALDEAMLARAAQAGCDIRRGETVQTLCPSGAGWCAQLSDGSSPRARQAFLATGKHDLRGWNRPTGRQSDLVGFKMHWRLNAAQTEALRGFMDLFLFDGGYGGVALVEDDVANLCLVLRRARLRRVRVWDALLAALQDENATMAVRLAGAAAMWDRPLAISSIPYGYLSEKDDGVWRVGDQAAVIPSFTGDGMAIAMHSGALAAEMCMAGGSPVQYRQVLNNQLKGGMRVATLLSRAMVSRSGRELAPLLIPLLPQPIAWIARSTRIPEQALVLAN
jgi:flavin-dependent dehydrogenase